jgi:acetyltransferase-like isoleucine patch superfamily enzyme
MVEPSESALVGQASHGVLEERHFVRQKLFGGRKSILRRYTDLSIGRPSLAALFLYEAFTTFIGPIPGALGLFLRKLLYPLLFLAIGSGVVFGRNVVIRHAHRIRLGDQVHIDDDAVLDARGAGPEGLVIGDRVVIGRRACVQAKLGPIRIGSDTQIGSDSVIVSQGKAGVEIDDGVMIGGSCMISGGRFRIPAREARDGSTYVRYSAGPVRIGRRCVLTMGAMVLDNVTIGEGTLVGAGAVVTTDVPPHSIVSPRPPVVIPNPDLVAGEEKT